MEPQLILASSSTVDAGISYWELDSGKQQTRFLSSSSPSHGLTTLPGRFVASSQSRESTKCSSSGSVFFWSWNKPQVEVRSFPVEPIKPLLLYEDGTYLIGGGVSGHIYLWEVKSGKLLKKWYAHYRAVSCLTFNDDQALLISGSEDGCVRVWSFLKIFDDQRQRAAKHPYEYSFSEHTLKVTHIVAGLGGSNASIFSASEDRTCKVWSLANGKLVMSFEFPSVIEAFALDPCEFGFYAGGRDGIIYTASLGAEVNSSHTYGKYIIRSLSEQSKAITALALSKDGFLLVSGSEDGMIRVWNTRTGNISRSFRHGKGPISNVLVIRQPPYVNPGTPPPLEKYENSSDQKAHVKTFIGYQTTFNDHMDYSYISSRAIENQIKELQRKGSSAANEMELERMKHQNKTLTQMVLQQKKIISELLDGKLDNADGYRT